MELIQMELITKKEAADRAAVSVKQLNRWIKGGYLPVISLGSSCRGDRIDPHDLNSFLLRRKRSRKLECQLNNRKMVFISSAFKSMDNELKKLFGAPGKKPNR